MAPPRPAIATAAFRDGAILHDAGTGRLFWLNGSGAAAWKALRRGRERDQIAGLLAQRHGVARERAQADVAAFVAALRRDGLLRRPGAAARLRAPKPPDGPAALQATYLIGGRRVAVACHSPRVAAGFAPLVAPALAAGDAAADLRLTLHFAAAPFA